MWWNLFPNSRIERLSPDRLVKQLAAFELQLLCSLSDHWDGQQSRLSSICPLQTWIIETLSRLLYSHFYTFIFPRVFFCCCCLCSLPVFVQGLPVHQERALWIKSSKETPSLCPLIAFEHQATHPQCTPPPLTIYIFRASPKWPLPCCRDRE